MKVLAVAGDAGGARALLPVLRLLRASEHLDLRAYGPAVGIWREAGLDPQDPRPVSVSGVDSVLAATSMNAEQMEVEFIRAGRTVGTPSVAVLDGWTNLAERFTSRSGERVVPHVVAVPDQRARRDVAAVVQNSSVVVVTGHPALDGLLDLRPSIAARRARVREELGTPQGMVVTFASQPISDLIPPARLGFHHREVLPVVVDAIGTVAGEIGCPILLLVRLHPREADQEPHLPAAPAGVTVRISPPLDLVGIVAASDLMIGISSMVLLEASVLGLRVVRYQPGLRIPDPLPLSGYGWSRVVHRPTLLSAEIAAALREADGPPDQGVQLARRHDGAARRVVALVRATRRMA